MGGWADVLAGATKWESTRFGASLGLGTDPGKVSASAATSTVAPIVPAANLERREPLAWDYELELFGFSHEDVRLLAKAGVRRLADFWGTSVEVLEEAGIPQAHAEKLKDHGIRLGTYAHPTKVQHHLGRLANVPRAGIDAW